MLKVCSFKVVSLFNLIKLTVCCLGLNMLIYRLNTKRYEKRQRSHSLILELENSTYMPFNYKDMYFVNNSKGNSLEYQNNEKLNFYTVQLYLNNLNSVNQEKQTLELQKINKSVKNTFIVYVDYSQKMKELILKEEAISNINSNDENTASHNHSPMSRRSKIKTNRIKQQSNQNTWKTLFRVSVYDICREGFVRSSIEGHFSSKRQYGERPGVQWPSMHPLLPYKNRHLDDDDISN